MDPAFGLEPAVCVRAGNLQGDGFDARLLARHVLLGGNLVAPFFGPAYVHAHQHHGPVLAFGAARPGVNFDIGVVAIGLARKQAFHFHPLGLFIQFSEYRFGLDDHALVALCLGHFQQLKGIGQLACQAAADRENIIKPGSFFQELLGARRVVPEAGIFGPGVQDFKPGFGLVPVKDTSSAVRATA